VTESMLELTVDGAPVRVPAGFTLLETTRAAGVQIPTLCWQPDLPHHASCMICLVEDEATGALLPSCSVPAENGQHISTSSRKAVEARRASLELLLADHESDCAECVKARSCVLRRLERELGADRRRFRTPSFPRREAAAAEGGLSWRASKCIRCGICVRICERTGVRPGISFSGRGFELSIRGALGAGVGTALGEAAAECISRCPTGALARQES